MNTYGFPHEEKQQRAEAWVAAWHTMQASTDRVERVRAEIRTVLPLEPRRQV